MPHEVTDNAARHRYELSRDGAIAHADYRRQGDTITFVHTEVPEAMAGKGIGSALVRGALDDARAKGLRVVARCPFVAAWIERHPEYRDLLAATGQG